MKLQNEMLAGARLHCPHCGVVVLMEPAFSRFEQLPPNLIAGAMSTVRFDIGAEAHGGPSSLYATAARCPDCRQAVIAIGHRRFGPYGVPLASDAWFAWPRAAARAPIPASVPAHIAEDYREAALVLSLSPKASAALSRRCLQHLLREQGYAQHDLVKQIEAARDDLPKYLAHELDAVRTVGNFAAHPMKSVHTGEILGVEEGEAEWGIEVLEMLFEHFYLRPADAMARREALNSKLVASGKKPLA